MAGLVEMLKSRGKLGAMGIIALSGLYLVDSFASFNISDQVYLSLAGMLEGLALFGIRAKQGV